MLDHVSIGVSDIARSGKFYDTALKPLGYTRLSDGESSLGYGDKAVELWLGAARKPVKPDRESVCISASSPRTAPRSTPSMPPRSRPAARTTASPACAPTTVRNTTPPSPSTPTVIASRPIAENDHSQKRLARFIAGANLEAMTTHNVETATAAEEAAVFAVLTLAFGSDPATRWTWPDPRALSRGVSAFGQGVRRSGV